MKTLRFAALVTCGLAVSVVSAQNPMRAGEWEITMQMQMANLPMQMPVMKTTQCVTQEEIDEPGRALQSGPPGATDSCKVTDQKIDGNKVSWKMACNGMTATGDLTFEGDTYKGVMTASTPQGEMTMNMSGKRLGACEK